MSRVTESDPLFGKEVASCLAALEVTLDPVAAAARLRRVLPEGLAPRAAALHHARARARARFPDAERLFFTARSLEQATHPRVAAERAQRMAAVAPGLRVADLTCGAGGDALALSAAGSLALAGDRDPEVLRCARANLEARGLFAPVALLEARNPPLAGGVALLLDPDRRATGKRSLRPADWSPSLAACLSLAVRAPGACLKLGPATDPRPLEDALPPGLPARLVWCSRAGELAELALYLGALAGEGGPRREAVGLSADGARAVLAGEPEEVAPLDTSAAAEARWIAEPDPAVIRAGLLGLLARSAGLAPVGPGIAFLAGEEHPSAPLLKAWRVLGSASADARRVRALLAEHDIGAVDVKARGHPEDPATLARRWRGRGTRRGLLLVARLARGHRVYLVTALNQPTS